jgi:N-acetylglucosaminyl-diphospho-decaprenol L-rhamnosyltransferase
MSNYIKLTIILIAYKSENRIKSFIKKIPKKIKIIIIENSNNHNLKKKIEKRYKNIRVFIKKNQGVSSSLNYAVKKVKTEYFLQISPDILFDCRDLDKFFMIAKKLKNRFSALGPRFLSVNNKSHKQIDKGLDVGAIDSVHGSCMFINKRKFKEIGGFDNNFFLYYEESDYCRRGNFKNFKCYQINSIKVKSIGRTVKVKSKASINELKNLLAWHFIWSEFNYNRKIYGKIITIIKFLPTLVRSLIKKYLFKFLGNDKNYEKYNYRIKGLMAALMGKKSYFRPKINY